MSYLTVWYALDDAVYDAIVWGKETDGVVEAMARAVAALPKRDRDNLLNKWSFPEGVPSEGRIADLLRGFMRCRRTLNPPEDEEEGVRMTLTVNAAIEALGTRCGDFTEGSPSVLDDQAKVYRRTAGLEPLARICDEGFGYADGWPYFVGFDAEDIRRLAAAAPATFETMSEEDQRAFEGEEEFEGVIDVLKTAAADGRCVVTSTS